MGKSRQARLDGGLYAAYATLVGLLASIGPAWFRPFASAALVLATLLPSASQPAWAAEPQPAPPSASTCATALPCGEVRASDAPIDFWLVNARCITERCPRPGLEGGLRYSQWVDKRWAPKSLAELIADSDPREVTVFVLHGNLFTHEEAIQFGRDMAVGLRRSCSPLPAMRVVIWSWPSEREFILPEADFQLKAERSDVQGYLMANVVAQLPPEALIRCVGFSYGCRMMFASYQYLAGGVYRGQRLVLPAGVETSPKPRSLGGVAMAAAFPGEWLAPGGPMGLALTVSEQVVVFVNREDKALWRLPRLFDDRSVEAVGVNGARKHLPAGYREHVVEYDVADEIGRQHRSKPYLESRGIMTVAARHLLEAGPATLATPPSPPAGTAPPAAGREPELEPPSKGDAAPAPPVGSIPAAPPVGPSLGGQPSAGKSSRRG